MKPAARVTHAAPNHPWAHVQVAMIAALVTNLMDGVSTWVGITLYHGQEAGIVAWAVVRVWGLIPALLLMKGSAVLFILGIAVAGTEGEPRWWRVRATQRWVVIGALWIAMAWFGYLALRNATGAWILYRLGRE